FTLSWLKRFLNTDASIDVIANTLNAIGFEVESVTDRSKELEVFCVAEILEAIPHPNADKLRICTVASGDGILQIVCGAPNARAGIKVILAKVGAIIPNGNFQIKAAEIRGIASNGMLCSEVELMIGSESGSIAELPSHAVVGEEFAKYYGLNDPVIEISVTPNRGDCLGVYYIAKELAAKGLGEVLDHKLDAAISVDAGGHYSYPEFATLNIRGIQNKQSPEWLQLLLKNIGQDPISAVVDITNYICMSFARPMHAYDSDKLHGELEVNYALDGEKFSALNGKEYELSSEDLVVRDGSSIQALAGIIGGALSSCDMETQNITLESAIFDPILVAKSGRRHKIDTDSRHRFERGVDPAIVIPALKLAASMILEICGGECLEVVEKNTCQIELKKLAFNPAEFSRVTGLSLPREEIVSILCKLGFGAEIEKDNINLTIPSFRHDISLPEDIIEEIIRIYGYEHLPPVALPDRRISRVLTSTQRRSFDARRILASKGYDELVTWSFMDSKKVEIFGKFTPSLQLQNPISSELDYMRPSIIPNILGIIEKNLARSFENLSFFEIGPVFGEEEVLSIAAAKTGDICAKNPHGALRKADLFDVKGDMEMVLSEMGLKLDKFSLWDAPAYYHPYRSASINLGKNLIGYFGEIHPSVLESFNITNPVSAFELNLNAIPEGKLKYGNKGAFNTSNYQSVRRDFAFLVNAEHPAGGVIALIQSLDKKLIREVCLFDVYAGDKIAPGKKSLAFNVIFQADNRTLSEEEINALSAAIIDAISQKYEATLRG
ncbi:MAG: phenylalanine--tRNA ligase subunit beta, partial [Pseudomonadota bacterium]